MSQEDNTPRVLFSFLSQQNCEQRGPQIGGMEIQVGDPVTAWITASSGAVPVDGYLVGVHVDIGTLTFDVAFPVAGQPDLYIPVRNLACRVLPRGQNFDGTPQQEGAAAPASFSGLRVVAGTAHQPADIPEGIPERPTNPSDDKPVTLRFPCSGEIHHPYWEGVLSLWSHDELLRRKVHWESRQGQYLEITFDNRAEAVAAIASFRRIQQGFDPIEEVELLGKLGHAQLYRRVRSHGLPDPQATQPYTLEYPMGRDGCVFGVMSNQLPEGTTIPFQTKWSFQVTYPNRAVAEQDIQRFVQHFPTLEGSVKPVVE